MIALISLFLAVVASLFRSKARLEAENALLWQQLIVLRRKMPGRHRLSNSDRIAIDFSSSGCAGYFRRRSRPLYSSGPKHSSDGIGMDFVDIGAGSRVLEAAVRGLIPSFAP